MRTGLAIAGVALTVVAVVAAILSFTVVPHVLANLATEVVAADSPVPVGDEATVTVPAGWAVQHPPFEEDTVRVISPDGGLVVTVTLVAATADDALDARGADAARVTEPLTGGLQARHAGADEHGFLAAVGSPQTARVLVFDATAPGGDIAPYTRALAQLLDGAAL